MPASTKTPKAKKKQMTVAVLRDYMEEHRSQLEAKTKQCLLDSCSFIFKKHDNVAALRWQQVVYVAADIEPFLKPEDYHIDAIEYMDRQRNEWVSAWNCGHVTSSELLDDLIDIEHMLLEMPLAQALGGEKQITVSKNTVQVDSIVQGSVQ